MTSNGAVQIVLYLGVLLLLVKPLGGVNIDAPATILDCSIEETASAAITAPPRVDLG